MKFYIINSDQLPNPIELFEAGDWTWDAMLEIMRAATRSTRGDGVIDQFGIAGQPGDIVMHLIGANDGIMVNENFNYGFDHPNTVAALEFAEQIFLEALWAHEPPYVMDVSNWDRNFYSGKRDGNAALFPAITWSLDNMKPNFNYGFVPFPTGPNNTTGNTSLGGLQQGLAVPVGTDWDITDILIILEELFSWPGNNPELLYESFFTEWMREVFPTEADVQRAIHAGRTVASDIGRDVPQYYWVTGYFAAYFHNREMDTVQAIEYHRAAHQEMLDRRFNR